MPFQPFDTGWEFIPLIVSWMVQEVCPSFASCHAWLSLVATIILSLPTILKVLFVRGSWSVLLHASCCLVLWVDIIIAMENWIFYQFDIFSYVHTGLELIGKVVYIPTCAGRLPERWDHFICCGGLGPSRPRFQFVLSPSCTSGNHGRVRRTLRHVNKCNGSWSEHQDKASTRRRQRRTTYGGCEPPDGVPWFHLQMALDLFSRRLRFSWDTSLHFRWWILLRHQLAWVNIHIHRWLGYHCYLPRLPGYSFYNSTLWRRAALFGSNFDVDESLSDADFVFAACDSSLSTHSSPRPIRFFPSSFSIPSTQQLWPVLTRASLSAERRSGGDQSMGTRSGGDTDTEPRSDRGSGLRGSLSPLTLILDSGANLNIFANGSLLQRIREMPSLA